MPDYAKMFTGMDKINEVTDGGDDIENDVADAELIDPGVFGAATSRSAEKICNCPGLGRRLDNHQRRSDRINKSGGLAAEELCPNLTITVNLSEDLGEIKFS